jgi:hypothetical protein
MTSSRLRLVPPGKVTSATVLPYRIDDTHHLAGELRSKRTGWSDEKYPDEYPPKAPHRGSSQVSTPTFPSNGSTRPALPTGLLSRAS